MIVIRFIKLVIAKMALADIEHQIKIGDDSRSAKLIQRYFRMKISKYKNK